MFKNSLFIFVLTVVLVSCSGVKKQNMEIEHAQEIQAFLETLAFENLDKCYPEKASWTQAALLKKSIEVDYKFSDDCNLQGKFEASYLDEVPMQFQLKDKEFGNFKQAKALVKLHIHQHRNGVYYGFEVKEGSLIGPKEVVQFTAKYKVDTDPLTNELKPGSEKGEISILVPGPKKVIKQTFPFSFN